MTMDSATKILDIAEFRMRKSGYNAVSFRDIAGEMGIKSASLHYHFPKKEDLGIALVQRYTANFMSLLAIRNEGSHAPEDKLRNYVDLFRSAVQADQHLVCLCAVLGAEAPGLPDTVAHEVRAFSEVNITWLTHVFSDLGMTNPSAKAKVSLALLEGAMIISSVNHDPSVFETAAELVLAN